MKLRYGALLLAALGLFSCEKAPLNPAAAEGPADVLASFSLPKIAVTDAGLTRAVFVVLNAARDTLLSDTSEVAQNGYIRAKLKVPAGQNRLFQVSVLQGSRAVLTGSDSLDLKGGAQVELKMTLNFLVPALTLSPIDTTVTKDSTFAVYIHAHHVENLCTIGTLLTFSKDSLQVVDLGREDDFLKQNGGAVTQLAFTKDNANGRVKLVLGIVPIAKSVSGEGTIARVVFKALQGPSTALHLSLDNTVDGTLGLYDQMLNLMPAVALGSQITIN